MTEKEVVVNKVAVFLLKEKYSPSSGNRLYVSSKAFQKVSFIFPIKKTLTPSKLRLRGTDTLKQEKGNSRNNS